MNRISILFLSTLLVLGTVAMTTQDSEEVIRLSQTPGEFETTRLTLKAGTPYVFEVTNNGVDHEVGFVIARKGKTDQSNHVKEAYLKSVIKDGEASVSNTVVLEKGEYVYWCPLNPTPQYKIVVE